MVCDWVVIAIISLTAGLPCWLWGYRSGFRDRGMEEERYTALMKSAVERALLDNLTEEVPREDGSD